jgi:hypothetical protein
MVFVSGSHIPQCLLTEIDANELSGTLQNGTRPRGPDNIAASTTDANNPARSG